MASLWFRCTRVLSACTGSFLLVASLGCTAPPQTIVPPNGSYVVRPGNILRISVWPTLLNDVSGNFTVEETGLVYLPVVGVVHAAGMPIDSLRRVLREGYAKALKEPVVTVTVLFSVSIHDAVQDPGLYWAEPTWSLLDLIGEAGGFLPNAKQDRLRLIRDGNVLNIDIESNLKTGEGPMAIPLYSGDRIVVPRSRKILTVQNLLILLSTTSLALNIINFAR